MVPPFDHSGSGRDGDRENSPKYGFQPPSGVIGIIRSQARPLLWPSVGFLLGATFPVYLTLSSVLFITLSCIWLVAGVFLSARLARLGQIFTTAFSVGRKPVLALLLFLLGSISGSLRACAWDREIALAETLAGWHDAVLVEVTSVPQASGDRLDFFGKIRYVSGTQISGYGAGPKARVSLYRNRDDLSSTEVHCGDYVAVTGKVSTPQGAGNPGEFDYRRYLMGKAVFLEVKGTRNEEHLVLDDSLPHRRGFSPFTWLSGHINRRIENCFVGEERGMLKALLIGDKRDLSSADSANLRFSGLSRFISIAGFHVSWAALAVESLMKKATKNTNLAKVTAVLAAYLWAGLSGFSVGPLRALMCVVLKHGAFWMRRKYDPLNAFGICGLLIGFCVPYPLLDVSFQLSFAGMLAGWVVNEYGKVLSSRFGFGIVRDGLVRSALMAALLFPILSSNFGDVSVVGFFLGGIWSIFTVSVLVSSLLVLCAPLFLGRLFGWIPFLVVRGMRYASQAVAMLPFSAYSFPALGPLQTASYYGVLFLLMDRSCEKGLAVSEKRSDRSGPTPGNLTADEFPWEKRSRSLCKKAILLILSLVFFASTFIQYYPLRPEVVFLSVGQGDAAIIRFKDVVIAVDTGTESSAQKILVPYLKTQGIKEVDLCILSHLDSDHAGGFPILCKTLEVKHVITCPGSKSKVSDFVQGCKSPHILEAKAEDIYKIKDVTVTVIYPKPSDCIGTFSNEDSLVFTLEFEGFPVKFEFWGDAPCGAVLRALERMRQIPDPIHPPILVVKVPHHGSPESLVDGFYQRLSSNAQKGIAIISVGPNSYGHPSPHVIQSAEDNGFNVMCTDHHGAITLRVSRGSVLMLHYRGRGRTRIGTNSCSVRRF